MYSLLSGYWPKSSEYPRYNSQTVGGLETKKAHVWILQSHLEEGNKIITRGRERGREFCRWERGRGGKREGHETKEGHKNEWKDAAEW